MAQNKNLEKHLEGLAREVENRKQPSVEGGGIEREQKREKNHLHEIIGEKIYGETERPAHEEARHEHLPATHGDEPPSYNLPELHDKVQELVTHAFEHDLEDAIKKAKETQDAALIDAFHDALVDELHDHLVNQGKLDQL